MDDEKVNIAIADLEDLANEVEKLRPSDRASDLADRLRDAIYTLQRSIQAPAASPVVATPPKPSVAGRGYRDLKDIKPPKFPPGIRPCWVHAHWLYEWGMKTLPPNQQTMPAIFAAACANEGDLPRWLRLPASAKTFAAYVRQYLKSQKYHSHRMMRRKV